MNLLGLFETQAALDARIFESHPELKGQDNLDWKVLALQVELGECANEWRQFKKWSHDQEPRTYGLKLGKTSKESRYINPLLEEYVDCLHFILSIGIELGFENFEYNFTENEFKDSMEAYRHVFNWCVNIDFIAIEAPFIVPKKLEKAYYNLFMSFVWLGEKLGFTWEQIEQAYYAKNEVNHQRQESGY